MKKGKNKKQGRARIEGFFAEGESVPQFESNPIDIVDALLSPEELKSIGIAAKEAAIDAAKKYIATEGKGIIQKETRTSALIFQAKFIEILAIFVALFTFVSVDIQIFKSGASFLSATGTSLITLGALIFFIFVLHFVLNPKNYIERNKTLFKTFAFAFFGLLLTGIICIGIDYSYYGIFLKENFYQKTDADKIFINKEESYDKKYLQNLIEVNNKNKQILDCIKIKGYFAIQCFQ